MKKILIIDDEEAICDILQMLIESEFKNPLIICSSGFEAIEILKNSSDIAMIISDYSMPNGTGGDVYQFNLKNTKLPFSLISGGYLEQYKDMDGFFENSFPHFKLPKPFSDESLFDMITKSLEYQDSVDFKIEDDGYKRINIFTMKQYITKYFADCYIKLSSDRYVHFFKKGEIIESSDVEKMKEKDEIFFYMKSSDFNLFKKEVITNIVISLKQAKDLETSEKQTVKALGFYCCASKMLNIDKYQFELINSSVESCMRNLEKEKSLKNLLNTFVDGEGYFLSHSITSLHISYLILKESNLYSENIMKRLSYAALLHDLTVSDNELSSWLDITQGEFSQLDKVKRDQIKEHAKRCTDLINEIEAIPSDVLTIIREHHEKPDGTGFPRGINSSNINSLSAVFIISLWVADHLFYHPSNLERLKSYVSTLEVDHSFNAGVFKKPFEALNKVVNSL